MTREELVMEIQAGATERLGELWEQVAGMVRWKAKQVMTAMQSFPTRRGVEFDDLYQSGYPAMVEAVESYDPTSGAFSAWFMYYLKKAFEEATGRRTKKGNKEPLNNYLSLDTPLSDDTDSDDLMGVIADPEGLQWRESVEESLWREQLHEALEGVLSEIPKQQSEILRRRYYKGETMTSMAQEFGITPEEVRKHEHKGLQTLRRAPLEKRIRPFYYFDCYCGTSVSSFRRTGMSIQERYLVIEDKCKK